jgi:hypothetical protein
MIAPPPLPTAPLLQPVQLHHSGVPLVVIRQDHLRHENALKSLGILHLLAGGIFAFASIVLGLGFAFSLVAGTGVISEKPEELVMLVLIPAFAALHLQVGLGLRRLKASVRTVAILLACFGLLSFPLGTLINAAALSYLLSGKGAFVFTEEYRDIISQTPHVKAKTSITAVILLIVALFILTALLLPWFL